jgi:hypothetical protein
MSLISLRKEQHVTTDSLFLLPLSLANYGMTEFTAMNEIIKQGYQHSLMPLAGFEMRLNALSKHPTMTNSVDTFIL